MTCLAVKSGGAAVLPDWQAAFARLMPELEVVGWADACAAPERVDFVLAWEPEGAVLRRMTGLRAIISSGAGVDHITRDPEWPRHVPLYRMGDAELGPQMAEYVLWASLCCLRRAWTWRNAQANHEWLPFAGNRLAGDMTVGIMGLGNLGREVATRLVGAGFGVAGWARSRHDVPGVACHAGEDGFLPFLGGLDILVCLLPSTPETRGILGARTFAALPRGACVINAGRGSHLAEADLIAALDAGQVDGAVLDVFAPEPLAPENPLWAHPKIIITPHAAAEASRPAKAVHAVEVIRAVLRGEEAKLRYRPERGY
ncbi:glyoxylate/hydroxypyruvate reductase A [Gluconacetobacter liquefaciens]|uniref:Glyoxylate/hydroxypyruvate reductase A n=1 Tax=Gluconacetobacter liquefaciens TaxID=89584 RepID=A0A370FYR0_GLULI|nr:glyoxylate/hydroxypyruvate reductase A [Gluconacetobacter liquefaciens]MBB2187225.1 glyoxylate/hydroxypyruvate reductase A [Gluconacetobacter liquefaciens]RDI36767.1 glyoxylate/hydroxypyruvate reductase A [Gluconacetobacter liquefaciens]GEB38453.1 glyoxylate/hydroxypyruvate reductase A [Gluconacetobacter liquefaciens]